VITLVVPTGFWPSGDVRKVEHFHPKGPSTNREFISTKSGVQTRDNGQRPLRNVPIFLDKHRLLTNVKRFTLENVKRFTFFPQARLVSP
jgi:hypothetical protein